MPSRNKRTIPVVFRIFEYNFSIMVQLLLTIAVFSGVLLVCFVLLNIRHILTGRQFQGSCSQMNPILRDKIGECSVCGKKADEMCKMPEVK